MRSRAARILASLVGAMALMILLAIIALYALSGHRMQRSFDVRVQAPAIPAGPEAIQTGDHIAAIRACADCHGDDYGGKLILEDPMLGTIAGNNLTRGSGGLGSDYTASDWMLAIRHGVRRDGSPLLFMPSHEYSMLSDKDLAALIAYLQIRPPVDREPIPLKIGPLFRLLYLLGEVALVPAERIDHTSARPEPTPGATAEYGEYLAATCTGCHGDGLSGGKIPGAPPTWPVARNLTRDPATGLGSWDLENFRTALREGRRPDGTSLDPAMPRALGKMTDMELEAIWTYLRVLPERPAGNR